MNLDRGKATAGSPKVYVWGLFGFAYPSAPIPAVLNVLSKLLAFVTILFLFLPQRARATPPGSRAGAASTL